MEYTITGQLCGYICPNVEEQLSNAEVRLYRPEHEGQELLEVATASTKRTARVLEDDASEAKRDRLIGRDGTDGDGSFDVTVGENVEFDADDYQGEAVEIDVYLETVPGETAPDPDPVHVAITTVQPEWRKGEDGAVFPWDHCFARDFWCGVRERFGAYVVCGRALQCEGEDQKRETRAGLTVRARDADIVQHEVLGTATTDADGYFRIYYSRADFERVPTPFTPIELFGGPDLFFEVDDTAGNTIYAERPSRGRESDREDAGACEHVRLCVDLPPRPDDGDGQYTWPVPWFTEVGTYDVDTEIVNGYAQHGGDDLAFTGTFPLRGVMPPGDAPTAWEYRFTIEDLDTGDVTAIDADAIRPTRIGTLQYWTQTSVGTWELEHDPYWLEHGSAANDVSADAQGWIEVPREDDLGSAPSGGSSGVTGTGAFARDTGDLVRFDSEEVLREAVDLTGAPHVAGEALDPGERSQEHAFAITFEARPVGNPAATISDTLSRIVISNTHYEQLRHPSWAASRATLPGVVMLDVDEFVTASDGCIGIDDTVTARVSAYNPHINHAKIHIEGPGASQSTTWTESDIGADGELATTHAFNTSSLQPCAYILWLEVRYDLTRGFGRIDHDHDHIGFCISGGS